MSYLVDTDVVVGWLKGRQEEISLLRNLSQEGLAVSLITYGEVYDGVYYGRNTADNERAFQQFLRWVDVFPLDQSSMRRFARIRGQLRQTGQLIGDSDILIAATSLDHDLTLITHNIRHFNRIPNLKLYRQS
jgi:predicted nucleic acid-binding protein